MPDGNRNILDNVTPTATLPVRVPGASGHQPHIPTAPARPAPVTRAMLDREIAAARQHEPYLIGYGGLQADAAFGGAA